MKPIILKYILAITVLSFVCVTKWWYVLVVDGTDEVMYGFPFIYMCKGFHTSMSLQFFMLEFFDNLFCYFLFWYVLFYLIDRFVARVRINRIVSVSLNSLAVLTVLFALFFVIDKNNLFFVKRHFDIEIMETGYQVVGQNPKHQDYCKYHPERCK